MTKEEIILAIDPGTIVTGYAIVSKNAGKLKALDYGAVRPPRDYKLSDRYLVIYNAVEELIGRFSPFELAVETQFLSKNFASALKLGMARAAAMLAAKKQGLSVYGYTPSEAKSAVVGSGKASKWQVQKMVQQLLFLPEPPEPEDAADALALAICHAQRSPLSKKEI